MISRHVLLGAIQLISLLVSLAAQVLVAQRIGPGIELDLYFSSFGFATATVGGVGVAATYLVPAYIHSGNKEGVSPSIAAGNCILAISLFALVVGVFSMAIFIRTILSSEHSTSISGYFLVIFFCWISAITAVSVSVFTAIGVTYNWVEWPLIFAMSAPLSTLLCLFWFDDMGVVLVAAFQCIGIIIQLSALAFLLRKRWFIKLIYIRSVVKIVTTIPVAMLGAICFSGYSAVDAVLAPLLGAGVLSHQALAQRLVIAFGAVVSVGPFMLAPSFISSLVAASKAKEIWKYLIRTSLIMVTFGLMASFFIFLFGVLLVQVLFESGEFYEEDTKAVARTLTYLLVGAGSMLATSISFRVLHCLNRKFDVAVISCLWLAIYAVLGYGLSNKYGAISLSISYSIAWVIIFIISIVTVRYHLYFTMGNNVKLQNQVGKL